MKFRFSSTFFFNQLYRAGIPKSLTAALNDQKKVFDLTHSDFNIEEHAFDRICKEISSIIFDHKLEAHEDEILFVLLRRIQDSISAMARKADPITQKREIQKNGKLIATLLGLKNDPTLKISVKTSTIPRPLSIPAELGSIILSFSRDDIFKFLYKIAEKSHSKSVLFDGNFKRYLTSDRIAFTYQCIESCYELKSYLSEVEPELARTGKIEFTDRELDVYYDVVRTVFNVDVTQDFYSPEYTSRKFIRSFLTNRQAYEKAKKQPKK